MPIHRAVFQCAPLQFGTLFYFCANLLLLRLRSKIKTGAFEFLLLDFVRNVFKRPSFCVYLIAVVLCIFLKNLFFFYLRRKPAAPESFAASAMGK